MLCIGKRTSLGWSIASRLNGGGVSIDFYFAMENSAVKRPRLPAIIIMPARRTPSITAMIVFLKLMSRRLAARVPVHAPVPGSGIPTKSSNATKIPRPAFDCNFSPAAFPLIKKKSQSFPMIFFPLPHSRNFLANR